MDEKPNLSGAPPAKIRKRSWLPVHTVGPLALAGIVGHAVIGLGIVFRPGQFVLYVGGAEVLCVLSFVGLLIVALGRRD